MKTIIILAATAALATSSAALAAPIRIEPVENLGAMVEYRDGMAGARSSLAKSDVALLVRRATLDEKDMPNLAIGVANHGQAPFNLTPASVRVTTQSGEVLPVYSRDEISASVEALARKRAKRARFAASLDAMGAAMRDQPTAPNRRLQENAARADEEGAAMVEAAQGYGFVAQTVQPGEQHITDLGLDVLPKDATELKIQVTVAGETHTFPLTVTRSH